MVLGRNLLVVPLFIWKLSVAAQEAVAVLVTAVAEPGAEAAVEHLLEVSMMLNPFQHH
tara:strand:- start:343 stop:516 length:174 start_codon:yes stop_codon:yes gene_type:complete